MNMNPSITSKSERLAALLPLLLAVVAVARASASGYATVTGNFCGGNWNDLLETCTSSTPCASNGDCDEAAGEMCYINFECELPPVTSSPTGAPHENRMFCGPPNWQDHVDNCAESQPCPSGECPEGQTCYANSPCAAILDAGPPGIDGQGSTKGEPAEPAPAQQIAEQANDAYEDARCAADDDCEQFRVCNKPRADEPGFCGECRVGGAFGCPVASRCLPFGCSREAAGPARCYTDHELDQHCMIHLKDGSATCDVDNMVCRGQASSSGYPTVTGNYCGNDWTVLLDTCMTATQCETNGDCDEGNGEMCYIDFVCELRPTAAPTTAAPVTSSPTGAPHENRMFCGTSWADHVRDCAAAQPCPDLRCPPGQACFNDSPCAIINSAGSSGIGGQGSAQGNGDGYETVTGNYCHTNWNQLLDECKSTAATCQSNDDCDTANGEMCYKNFECELKPTASPTTAAPTVPPVPTAEPEHVPAVVVGNYCGTEWNTLLDTCKSATPCPGGQSGECPSGEMCYRDFYCEFKPTASPTTAAPTVTSRPTPVPTLSLAPSVEVEEVPGYQTVTGNYCGTDWILLLDTCKSATLCPEGLTSECDASIGEMCYVDFVCELKPSASPTTAAPATQSPSRAPAANTMYCGVTWAEHVQNCAESRPCPDLSCPAGQSCFNNSPCAHANDAAPPSGQAKESSIAMSSSTENWLANALGGADESKTQPGGGVVDGNSRPAQFGSYANRPENGVVADASMVANTQGGINGNDQAAADPNPPKPKAQPCNLCGNAEVDWTKRTQYDGAELSCGEFSWVFEADGIMEGSDKCLNFRAELFGHCCQKPANGNGCDLCDAGIDAPWHNVRQDVSIMFEGGQVRCDELSWKVRARMDPDSGECVALKKENFGACCFEKCSLCGESSIDWDKDTKVVFSGQEVGCHDLDTNIFVQQGVSKDSYTCEMSHKFYSEACCIPLPDEPSNIEPCDICLLSGVRYGMKSAARVSHNGQMKQCQDLHQSFMTDLHQKSEFCKSSQEMLFDQCCEVPKARNAPGGADSSATQSAEQGTDFQFGSWYNTGDLDSSSAWGSLSMGSICLAGLGGMLLVF